MANEIRTIVERLNDAPFNLNLTLAAFDEKSPFELLEVVNLVMGELSAVHKIDLRDETPEKTINRWATRAHACGRLDSIAASRVSARTGKRGRAEATRALAASRPPRPVSWASRGFSRGSACGRTA
jgi:hypothetical protein